MFILSCSFQVLKIHFIFYFQQKLKKENFDELTFSFLESIPTLVAAKKKPSAAKRMAFGDNPELKYINTGKTGININYILSLSSARLVTLLPIKA